MKYASQIIGLKVVAHDTGEQFQKVVDLTFNENSNKLLALVTEAPGLLSSAKIIPFEAIESIGDDAVVVPDKEVEVSADLDAETAAIIKKGISVRGKTVMTEDGRNLGKVSDLQIDELSGTVTDYQTSGGLFADAYNGRSLVPAPMTIRVGEDVVFVPNETAELMQSQLGGLKEAGQNAADKAGELKDQALSKGQELAGNAQDAAGNLRDQAMSPKTQGKLEDAKSAASGLFEQVKQKAVDFKDQASQKVEDRRINGALGKPASRVVLAKDDTVILNVGDIITHEAVEKARMAGELEVLLGSVYRKAPELTTEDMKAKERQPDDGSAAGHI